MIEIHGGDAKLGITGFASCNIVGRGHTGVHGEGTKGFMVRIYGTHGEDVR